jgi:hypothetical protein
VGRPGCNNCGGGAPPAAAMPTPAPQSARKAAPRVTSAQGKRPAGAYGTNARYAGYSNPRYANGGSNNQRYAGQGSNGAMRPYYNPNVAPRIISQTDRAVGEDETPQVARSRQAVVRQ